MSDAIRALLDGEEQRAEAKRRFIEGMRTAPNWGTGGVITWTRDEIHSTQRTRSCSRLFMAEGAGGIDAAGSKGGDEAGEGGDGGQGEGREREGGGIVGREAVELAADDGA